MNTPLVSIIIPCYRQAHLLPRAVQSCLDQTYPNLQIIVVDDGSPDEIVENLVAFENKIELVRQSNKGLSSARNTGLRHSKGQYIKFLDADDWLLPCCIEHQVLSIKNLNNYISVIGYRKWYDNSSHNPEDIYPQFGKLKNALCYVNLGPPHIYLFPSKIVKSIGGFDTSNRVEGGHEDYDLICRIAVAKFEAVEIHTVGCIYRQSANSMSTKLDKMSSSRSKVWINYAEAILHQDIEVELMVHLFAGYALRLASKDVRYNAINLLHKIACKIGNMRHQLNNELSILLLENISTIRKNLPPVILESEKRLHQDTINILDGLTKIGIKKIKNVAILKEENILILLNIMKSQMLIGRRWIIRKKIENIKMDRLVSKSLLAVLNILKLPSYFYNSYGSKKNFSKDRFR